MLKRINHKNKLYKKAKVEEDKNLKDSLEKEVKILQNFLKKDIQLEKDKYYQRFFKENKNNLIKVWKNIKSLINKKQKTKTNINCLYIDGKNLIMRHDTNVKYGDKIKMLIQRKNLAYKIKLFK